MAAIRHRSYRPRGELRDARISTDFVPAFSVRRAASLDTDAVVNMQHRVLKALPSYFHVYDPGEVSLTNIERQGFVKRLREANESPHPGKMRELAMETGKVLAEKMERTPMKLDVPLGQLAIFGSRENVLGVVPLGWRGRRARHARFDELGNVLPIAALLDENESAVKTIAAGMELDESFLLESLSRTPHIALASSRNKIRSHEFRAIVDKLEKAKALPPEITLDDPIIYFKPSAKAANEQIFVRTQATQPAFE